MTSGLYAAVAMLVLATGTFLRAEENGFEHIQDGQVLAEKLRALVPVPDSFTGILKVLPRDGRMREIRITNDVVVRSDSWEIAYSSRAVAGQPAEKLVVVHRAGQPNAYYYSKATNEASALPTPQKLSTAELATPFAGTDFWLCDLGQEFFHWPQQQIVNREMRKSRPCKVLESRPAPGQRSGYSRVLSWIDNETGGLLLATAYDLAGKVCKEFEVKSLSKVDGLYHVHEVGIQNLRRRSRTKMIFDVSDE